MSVAKPISFGQTHPGGETRIVGEPDKLDLDPTCTSWRDPGEQSDVAAEHPDQRQRRPDRLEAILAGG